jgi:hypothetical protein
MGEHLVYTLAVGAVAALETKKQIADSIFSTLEP